jgi:hypothetical protein
MRGSSGDMLSGRAIELWTCSKIFWKPWVGAGLLTLAQKSLIASHQKQGLL